MTTKIIRSLSRWQQPCVVTIGSFDGVHLGHQQLLLTLQAEGKQRGLPTVIVTFEPQPAEFLFAGSKCLARLTRFREKFKALAALQPDYVLVLRFNAELAALTAEDFITKILSQGLQAKHILVGDDFRFGHARMGDFTLLKQAGEKQGFTVAAMPTFTLTGERVSSTRVRKALAEGNQELAARLLGRPYTMEGRVVRGDQRGRQLGFPTANVRVQRTTTPLQGVYAVRAHLPKGECVNGVANLGMRPTVNGVRTLLEVHLLDFNQDIYGQSIQVEFCHKLREEQRFSSLDELKIYIAKDVEAARDYHALCIEK